MTLTHNEKIYFLRLFRLVDSTSFSFFKLFDIRSVLVLASATKCGVFKLYLLQNINRLEEVHQEIERGTFYCSFFGYHTDDMHSYNSIQHNLFATSYAARSDSSSSDTMSCHNYFD